MKTKYFVMMVVAVLMGTQVMNAQQAKGKGSGKHGGKRLTMEQVVNMQAEKIVNELSLDDKTAAKFTDVYKKYMQEQNDVRKAFAKEFPMREKVADGKGGTEFKMKKPTDAEVDKMMRERFKLSRKLLDVREKYYDEFRKFLSPKQVMKIYDQGQMDHGKFHKEMNRRAGMKKSSDGKRDFQKGASNR